MPLREFQSQCFDPQVLKLLNESIDCEVTIAGDLKEFPPRCYQMTSEELETSFFSKTMFKGNAIRKTPDDPQRKGSAGVLL
ncbi:MAG: hypothetical protein HQM08_09015 [Candidatus Riflebacteria bacterium]|nr:hypothetical protein [Candidatus Riflebacteria bacterium]